MDFAEIGVELDFSGKDENEIGKVVKLESGKEVVKVDPRYYRPTEVELLIGDPTKANTKLGWKPKYKLAEMVKEMVAADIKLFKKKQFLEQNGYQIKNEFE